ncbi:MAG: polymerase subunit delta [Solirubrobacteraceae bacterium]|nr:polymerase subunit delta [Solirubrobacteraceae bacterium]
MDVPGLEHHPHARAMLVPALPPDGHPSHAYLFRGPAGTGKRSVARAFAAALLADGSPDPAGARERVLRGSHPDLSWVAPTGAAEMLVSDIDEPVVAAAARTPFEATRRVFVIERAETMGDATANRLLKTLEEPADYAHLILLTDRPDDLLPTISSRCQHVRFDALPTAQLAARLEALGADPQTAEACARLGLGDGERAQALALGRGPELRAAAEGLARAALAGELERRPWLGLLELAQAAGERAAGELGARHAEELELAARSERRRLEREHTERARRAQRRASTGALDRGLALVGLWYRDVGVLLAGAPELVHAVDRREALGADAAGRDPAAVRRALELVEETRARMALNVTEELALEALAYRIAAG